METYGLEAFTSTGEGSRLSDNGLGYSFLIHSGAGSLLVSDSRQSQVEFVVSQSNVATLGSDPIKEIRGILSGDTHLTKFSGLFNHNLESVVYNDGHIVEVVAKNNSLIYLIGLYNVL